MNAFEVLKERGFVQQVTNEASVSHNFSNKRLTVYVGFDPTAESLHIGNLLCLMALAHTQRAGHRTIAIIGDGTALVGDPSGKTEMRPILARDKIASNAERIKSQIAKFIDIDGERGIAVHNATWLVHLKYIDFLREIGRHFSVNRMLAAEAYKARLKTGLSFLEFNYQLLQAYDFLMLNRDYDCTIQMGGDDQWGNILAGVDLIRRVERKEADGITWPLITTSGGQKMGKTASGALWLDAAKTSPYEYYQYWINVHDDDVRRFLACFTFLPMGEIADLTNKQGAELRTAKEALAFEATKIAHGVAEADRARAASQSAFGGKAHNMAAIPSTILKTADLEGGLLVVDLFERVGLAPSKSGARRLIEQGGAYVNENRITSIDATVDLSSLQNEMLVLRAGKKRYHRVLLR
ncbi:MAG: tyrosine--tRNA ligase [bacterium]